MLYQPSKPDGWEHLYQKIQRSGNNAGMLLNCYNVYRSKRYNVKCFHGKILNAREETQYLDGRCLVE